MVGAPCTASRHACSSSSVSAAGTREWMHHDRCAVHGRDLGAGNATLAAAFAACKSMTAPST
jgi:hypothetical protein